MRHCSLLRPAKTIRGAGGGGGDGGGREGNAVGVRGLGMHWNAVDEALKAWGARG